MTEKPRWPQGPKICAGANLPAFETEQQMRASTVKNSPSCKVLFEFPCTHCGQWHCWASAPPPAGSSSGTGRTPKSAEEYGFKWLVKVGVPANQAKKLIEPPAKPISKR